MQLPKWIAPCRVQLRRCRFAMRKGVTCNMVFKVMSAEFAPRCVCMYVIASASGQWLKLVALGQMSSVAHRRRNGGCTGAPCPLLNARFQHWRYGRCMGRITPNIGSPPPCAPPLVGLRTPLRSKCEITPFLIANRHLFTSDRQIALVSSAWIPLRQRSPHIDIVHLYKARGIENRHSAPYWHWSQNLGYWMSMPKLNAPAEIHCRRSNMNARVPILMKSVEVLKDCRSLNAAAEMNCPMPRSVEKVPIRNKKRCNTDFLTSCDSICPAHWLGCRVSNAHGYWIPRSRAISIRSKWWAPE